MHMALKIKIEPEELQELEEPVERIEPEDLEPQELEAGRDYKAGRDIDLVNLPPDGSDEDDRDDDERDDKNIDICELKAEDIRGNSVIHYRYEEPFIMGEDEPGSSNNDCDVDDERQPPVKKQKTEEPVWSDSSPHYNGWLKMSDTAEETRQQIAGELRGKTAVEVFEKIFTPEVFELIQTETLRYAKEVKNDQLFSLSDARLKGFIGILLYSGYNPLPSERMYWSTDDDLSRPIVRQAMTRAEYLKIKTHLHVQNNDNPNKLNDRAFKIRPLMNIINGSFQQFGVFQPKLSVDALLVRYYGQCVKQITSKKPVRLGYKLWAICGSDGYCHKFDLYCGEDESLSPQQQAARVALDLLSVLPDPGGHEVFFGTYFTSRSLLSQLKSLGIRATGRVSENLLRRECPITQREEMTKSKSSRGTYEQRFDESSEVLLVRWHNNTVTNIMTNYDTAEPPLSVGSYDRAAGKSVVIPKPKLIHTYDSGRIGVDLHEQLLSPYEVSIRGKKWYWCLITKLLDMAVVNSHILHKTAASASGKQPLSLLDFRREIVMTYLKSAANEWDDVRRTRPSHNPVSLRYDGIGHMMAPLKGRRRCRLEGCQLRTSKRCTKCDVAICFKCFVKYHQRSS